MSKEFIIKAIKSTLIISIIIITALLVYTYLVPALPTPEILEVMSYGIEGVKIHADEVMLVFPAAVRGFEIIQKSFNPIDDFRDAVDADMRGLDRAQKNTTESSLDDDSVDNSIKQKITPIQKQPIIPDTIPYGEVKSGKITKVIDGDTVDIDGTRIRLSLVNTPERGDPGYSEATSFTNKLCPVGTTALYDTDDKQQGGSHGRTIAKVWCLGYPSQTPTSSLNSLLVYHDHAEILSRFCSISEFSNEAWAVQSGC